MRRLLLFLLLLLASVAWAQTERLGVYIQGQRVGVSTSRVSWEVANGRKMTRYDSSMNLDMSMLGAPLQIKVSSTSWSSGGKPVRMISTSESGGRTQKMDARYLKDKVSISVSGTGEPSKTEVPIPKDAPIVDDPLTEMLKKKVKPGFSKEFYILDPTSASFVKNKALFVGPKEEEIRGKSVKAIEIDIVDPRGTTQVFVDAKGNFLKGVGLLGMELYPEKGQEANTSASTKKIDLALATSIPVDKPLKNPSKLKRLIVKLIGVKLDKLPSDAHQTVRKQGDGWILDIHPPRIAASNSVSIAQAGQQKPQWLKPDLHIPCDSDNFRSLARQIIGDKANVKDAALAIKAWVNQIMAPNASIGVLRDASEILATKEGVCRDYAILTATLMRAGGIPARLASGLVNWEGAFYYHAWVEVWDGSNWIGIDSTTPDEQLSAAHIKLAGGTVKDTFSFAFLDKATIRVISSAG